MMRYPLCIMAPHIGVQSETFVRRHMQDLLPGGTVVIADRADPPIAGHWQVQCPTLVLNRIPPLRFRAELVRACLQKLGKTPEDRQTEAVRRFLAKHGVGVIMGEYLDFCLPWLEVAREMGIRCFGHGHGYDIAPFLLDPQWRQLYLRFNDAGGIITVSELSRRRLVDIGIRPEKVSVVPCGVDVPDAPLDHPPRESVRCLAVGRMTPIKAPILMLDAFRRASQECPDLHLDYIGGGELLSAADQFIEAFHLEDRVTLHGAQPSDVVVRFMQQADIFVQHSRTDRRRGAEEGTPVAILEAMAHALPVVSTRHAGIPEEVVEGQTGMLVPEGDTESMAQAILRLARAPDLRRAMGEAGWERARDRFSAQRECDQLRHILGLDARTVPAKLEGT